MKSRTLGNSGKPFSVVGLGTWAIGGTGWKYGWGPQDERDAIDAILRAVELGVNWIDTAAVYGRGRSEELVGLALREIPAEQRPYIATKCSRKIQPDGNIGGVLKRESILREVDESRQRLGVDTIDLYQLHWPIPEEDIEEGWETLVALKDQGAVRNIGVSNFNVPQMQRLQAIHPITSLQPPYSLIVRDVESEILPYCKEQNIGVIVYSPMYKGLLSGKFSQERVARLPADDHRHHDPRFQSPQLEKYLEWVEQLRSLAQRKGCSVAQLAIAWTLQHPAVTGAIVGARTPQQIEDTVQAAGIEWSADELAEIQNMLAGER